MNDDGLTNISIRRVVLAIIAGCASAWIFATAAFIDFDPIRIRLVREAAPVQEGMARVHIRDERAAYLRPPFALIARLRNDAAEPLRFSIRINDRPVCEVDVPAGNSRRIDCEVRNWARRSEDELAIEPASPRPWAVEYVEIATHHGRSTGFLEALVLPRGGSHLFTAPSWPWAAAAGAGLAMLLLLPSRRFGPRWFRVGHVVASIVAIVPVAAAGIAPLVSPYRIVLSPWTFASWLSIPLLPRLWWIARSVWCAIPIRVRIAILTTPHLARDPRRLAWALAIALVALSVAYGGRVVGGADEYGYLSQADLWLNGRLVLDQPFVRNTPWPESMPSWFSPLGYRPQPTNTDAIVPVYSPGLPLMLAAAKFIGGQDAVFLVVPLCAGLLVLGTYALGRRLGSGIAPLVAAWLVATSPVVLSHAMATMSDVPVAAAWTGAFYLLLGTSTASAAGAGLLAGLAVLIRPNLAPLALVLGSLYVIRMRTSGVRALVQLVAFGMAATPAALAIAAINYHLYGSPLTSGYGPLAELFDTARMLPNLGNYLAHLIEPHTPVVLVGVAAIAFPARWLWPNVSERVVFIVIGAFVAALWAIYCAWIVFDTWWFGRFLLSSFPFIMLGVGACADALFRLRARWIQVSVVVAVIALGLAQLHFASTRAVFLVGPGMWRYAVAADLTRRVSEPNSVVIALNHSGTVRYYGTRMTINIGNIVDGGPIDELVDWFQQRGVRTYATFEDWEIEEVSRRFADTVFASTLNGRPRAVFNDPGRLLVHELSHAAGAAPEPLIVNGFGNRRRAVSPGAPPRLVIGPPRR